MIRSKGACTQEERRAARWVTVLLALIVLLQRVSTPGVQDLSILVPLVVGWCAVALARGVVVLDRTRLAWWLAAAGVTAIGMLVQNAVVAEARISITAWGLFMTVWLPFVTRLSAGSVRAYDHFLHRATNVLTALAGLTIVMVGSQLLGLPYRDWVGGLLPESLQQQGFVITYPIFYGSPIYRGNGWIGLEPSMISAQLGLGVLAALLAGARVWKMVVLLVGLVCTVSGSGVAIVVVGLVVVAMTPARRRLLPYAPLGAITVVAMTFTPFGRELLERSNELQTSGSSASLRALEPYEVLWPAWTQHLSGMLLGFGPGSSQRLVADTNRLGLLVPSPAKVFFEYGLIGGLVLASLLFICYWGGPSRAFGLGLLVSLWAFQPGTTTMVIVAPLLLFVTLWSPRSGAPLEDRLGRHRGDDLLDEPAVAAPGRDVGRQDIRGPLRPHQGHDVAQYAAVSAGPIDRRERSVPHEQTGM